MKRSEASSNGRTTKTTTCEISDSFDDEAIQVGDTIRLTSGAITVSPIEYQMYTVGPFEVETQRQSEETTGETVARARAMLEAIERIETERARDRFFSELEAGVPIARRFIERKLKERREARRTR